MPIPTPIRSTAAAAVALLLSAAPAPAQARVEYEVSFPNAVHHEAEVSATFRGAPAGRPLQVRMSRSSPGRYALHEFAKNVYNVRATDGRGRPLRVTRPNPHQWDVAGHDGTVRVSYTVFGDRVDGTYLGIDETHAHMNMPATFMWARGMDRAPIRVTFRKPRPEWSVATQLVPTADSATFTAPDLQYFMDSPTEVGPVRWRSWQVATPRGPRTVRIAMHHLGTDAELDAYAEMVKRIVDEQVAVFGELPLDHGTYTFIVDYLPWANGDGMEHRNSTVVTSSRPLSAGPRNAVGTVSHEFFHLWNVERIRPRSLEPFDFEEANMSGELWFAEGFTSYFDDLFLRRAGILTDAEYAAAAAGSINGVLLSPGRDVFSAVEMSMQAPFVDAAASIDPQNRQNTYISYYTYGAAIGLGLDLEMRRRFSVTADDYMAAMWRRHGRTARPYTLADLRATLGEVTRDTAFANGFFRRHVQGKEAIDYAPLLAQAGFELRKARPGMTRLAASFQEEDGRLLLSADPLATSPLRAAGLSRGARIVSLDGRETKTVDDLRAVMAEKRAGDALVVAYEQRGRAATATVRLTEDPTLTVVPVEAEGGTLTPAQRVFRARWLDSHARGR